MADLNDYNKPTVSNTRVDVQDTNRAHHARAITLDPGSATNRPVGAKLAELISNIFTLKRWNGTAYDTWLTVSNFWRGVLDDADAAAARTSLGLPASAQANEYTAFTTAGSGTAYTLAPTSAIADYTPLQGKGGFWVTFHATNAAAATLNISTIGARNLGEEGIDGVMTALAPGRIVAGNTYFCLVVAGGWFKVIGLPATSGFIVDTNLGIPSWKSNPNSQVGTGWAAFQTKLNELITFCKNNGGVSATLTTPAGTYPGGGAFSSAVVLLDGRVFCIPSGSTTARIYDPVTDTLSTPAGTYPGGAAFLSGVLLPDGKVFCVPFGSTTARIYDPVTDTLTTPAGTYPGSSSFRSGVLLPDGRVFCIPSGSTTARIYDPITNTLSTPAGTYPGGDAFSSGVLLPDGKVFCVPFGSTSARIYDPITNTLSTPTGTYPGSFAFSSGVLLPDGKVFCVPFSSASARIYDPVANTLSTPAGTYALGGAFLGGVLLPDGRVFCVPYNSTSASIYDPVTDTVRTPAGTYPGGASFYGGVLLPDGRVFCVPYTSTAGAVTTGNGFLRLPPNIVNSPFFNKF